MAYDIFIFVVLIILNNFLHINTDQEIRCSRSLICACSKFNITCGKLLKTIPWEEFPVWIENLIIEDMPDLKEIRTSDIINPLTRLKHLNIRRTSLKYVELGVLGKLPSLNTLQITLSQLHVIPQFGLHTKLRKLILNGNRIASWSASALMDLPNLHTLRLSNNNVTRLETRFFPRNCSLRHLHLQSNNLKFIAPTLGIHHLPFLQVLKLQKNQLTFTKNVSFPSVQHLDLSRNTIKSLGGLLFDHWSSLRTLKLRRCGIEDIRDGAFAHDARETATSGQFWRPQDEPGLHQLDLSENPGLKSVQANWLFGMTQLRQLLLVRCDIRKLSAGSFAELQKLRELDISENRQLGVLGSGSNGGSLFYGLTSLEVLKVNGAGLNQLEVTGLTSLTTLRRLELRNNNLTMSDMIEGIMEPLYNLLYLDLRNNSLRRLRGAALQGAVRLESLDLRDNPIETVDPSALTALGNMFQLRELHLDSTRLLCASCLWRKFARWAVPRQLNGLDSANCSSGERLLSLAQNTDLVQSSNTSDDADCLVGLGPQLHLDPLPKSQVLVGANLTLQCAFRCRNQPLLWWEYSSVLIQSDVKEELHTFSRLRFLNRGRGLSTWQNWSSTVHTSDMSIWFLYLRLTSIRLEDKGSYRCLARNVHGQLASASAKVHVYLLPRFISQPFVSMVVQAGTTVEIPCAATGVPQPQTSLRKADGSRFIAAKERRIQVMRGDRSFFIAAVTRKDAGTYVCQSQSEAGIILSNFTLTVFEAPAFRSPGPPRRVRALHNASASLACLVDSLPLPNVEWSRDGHLLERNSTWWTFEQSKQVLRFGAVQKEHAGRYLCRLSNAVAAIEAAIDLQVLDVIQAVNQSSLAEAWTWTMTCAVVSAIVLGVLLTSLTWFAVILCLRRRRRKRKQQVTAQRLFARDSDSSVLAAATASTDNAQRQAAMKPLLHSLSPATIDTAASARQLFLELSTSASLQLLTSSGLQPDILSTAVPLSSPPCSMMYLNFSSEPSLALVSPFYSYAVSSTHTTAVNSTSDYHTTSSRSDSGSDSYQQLLLLQQNSTFATVVAAGEPVLEEDDGLGIDLVT